MYLEENTDADKFKKEIGKCVSSLHSLFHIANLLTHLFKRLSCSSDARGTTSILNYLKEAVRLIGHRAIDAILTENKHDTEGSSPSQQLLEILYNPAHHQWANAMDVVAAIFSYASDERVLEILKGELLNVVKVII